MADSKPLQESSDDRNGLFTTSRGRKEAVFPPKRYQLLLTEESRHHVRPPDPPVWDTPEVSMDFASLSVWQENRYAGGVAIPPVAQGCEERLILALPRQNTSPHTDRRHGNSSAYAASTSSRTSQHTYQWLKNYAYPDMASYQRRIGSFYNWPPDIPIWVQKLALANLFYEGEIKHEGETVRDQVICYKCGQSFRSWEENDDPIKEHKRIDPYNCFLVDERKGTRNTHQPPRNWSVCKFLP